MTAPRILLTAFEPYGEWKVNASWSTLVELTRELPADSNVTTRRYPVDFNAAYERIADDMQGDYDCVLLLGQAPGSAQVQLEKFAINVRGEPGVARESYPPLDPNGPAGFEATLPINQWAADLRGEGLPVEVSHHAGEYLCNASLYWTLQIASQQNQPSLATFVHLPLTLEQVLQSGRRMSSLPLEYSVRVVRRLIELCGALKFDFS